eukprot:GFKZ01009284.1.p4 GENE.GFKZ01009284.1~~GFKZ01009284.1.p4  ORF type:complete len:194 (+),score=50.49 GFKZ01009284.1:229-810(+)
MATGWAAFRKTWLKPEVYPLIGSMAAALGVCGAAILNKVTDPTVTWNKSKRGAGAESQLDGVDEVVPMWNGAKGSSVRIFGTENPIMENKRSFTQFQDTFVVKIGEEEEEEEEEVGEEEVAVVVEEDASDVVDVAAAEEAAATAAAAVVDVIDEAAETIKAAVDAAIIASPGDAAEPAASSVVEKQGGDAAAE